MPFEPQNTALQDILEYIGYAEEFVAGYDWPAFGKDRRTIFAVIRCLEVISEASRWLPPDLKARHPTIEWQRMAAAGNIYRHDYDDISALIVWESVQYALPPLRAAVEAELKRG
jgi:uncharacterized protein with HEPN domain